MSYRIRIRSLLSFNNSFYECLQFLLVYTLQYRYSVKKLFSMSDMPRLWEKKKYYNLINNHYGWIRTSTSIWTRTRILRTWSSILWLRIIITLHTMTHTDTPITLDQQIEDILVIFSKTSQKYEILKLFISEKNKSFIEWMDKAESIYTEAFSTSHEQV